jgi:hypothetical protein
MDTETSRTMVFNIKTVEDLINVLRRYPKDTKITYDYSLPIEIYELEDGSITIS